MKCVIKGRTKECYKSKVAAFRAIARGAHGNSVYICKKCKQWHTTNQVRQKPRRSANGHIRRIN